MSPSWPEPPLSSALALQNPCIQLTHFRTSTNSADTYDKIWSWTVLFIMKYCYTLRVHCIWNACIAVIWRSDVWLAVWSWLLWSWKMEPHKTVGALSQAGLRKQAHNFLTNHWTGFIKSNCPDPILGIQFLFKEMRDRPCYTCTLCHMNNGIKWKPYPKHV